MIDRVRNTVTGAGHSGIVVGGEEGVDSITVVNNVFAFNAHSGVSHDSTCPSSSRAHHNVVHGNGWGDAGRLLRARLLGRSMGRPRAAGAGDAGAFER